MTLRKNKIGKLILCDFRTYEKATVIKRVKYWGQERQIEYTFV